MARRSFLSVMLQEPGSSCRLVNVTRRTVVATLVEPAFDSRSRNRGLLGRDSLPDGSALVIAPSSAVHTFGMRFPIDLLFVDRAGVVLKVRASLKAGRIAWAWRAFAVVELTAGAAGRSGTTRGDVLAIAGSQPLHQQ